MKIKLLVEVQGVPAGTETEQFRGDEAIRLIAKRKAVPVVEPEIERAVEAPAPEVRAKPKAKK